MVVLAQIGPLMERLLGNAGYLVLYLVAGLAGGIVSSLWNPYLVSAGASGAIFGLYGALLAFLARDRGSIPPEVLAGLKRGAFVFVGYNLLFGLTEKNVDVAAHVGGFACGFLAALLLAHPLTPAEVRRRQPRDLGLALAGVALFALFVVRAPHVFDLQGAFERMGQLEHRSIGSVNAAIDKVKAGGSERELAELIERDVLPPWRRSLAELEGARRLPIPQARLVAKVVTYMKARAAGWEMLGEAIKNDDQALFQRAREKQAEADKLANEIGK
jgi:rhomboid protease GluP